MSDFYGPADETESIATIHAALDAGITLLDTGDYYASGHNELLIGRALRDRRDKALISVKFGALRGPDGKVIRIRVKKHIALLVYLAVERRRHHDRDRPRSGERADRACGLCDRRRNQIAGGRQGGADRQTRPAGR